MKESKAVYVTKRDIKDELNKDYIYTNKVIRDREFSPEPLRYDQKTQEVGCQYDSKRDNLICTCRNLATLKKRQEVRYFGLPKQIYAYHGSRSFTDIGVGSVKALQRKKVKKIYLPTTDDRGVGSSDLSRYLIRRNRQHRGSSYYDNKKTSSKCVGGILEYNIGCVMNEKLSPIVQTVSGSTSPRESKINRNIEIGSNTVVKSLTNTTTQVEDTVKKDIEIKPEVETEEIKPVLIVQEDTIEMKTKKIDSNKSTERKENQTEKDFSSDSLVQHVHNLENPSDDKQSHISLDTSDPMENKLEREYRRIFVAKSKEAKPSNDKPLPDFKSTSTLKRRFEALRRGLAKREDSKKNAVIVTKVSSQISAPSRKDVSINSDPPSLEGRSYSNTKTYSPYTQSYSRDPTVYNPRTSQYRRSVTGRKERDSAHWSSRPDDDDSECQGVKGMFKLWGKKFNLEEDYYKKHATPKPSYATSKRSVKKVEEPKLVIKKSDIEEKKEGRKFFFFKKKNKEKPYKSKKGVTAGRCEVRDGLMIKIGAGGNVFAPEEIVKEPEVLPEQYEDMVRKAWLKKFLSQAIESRNSVQVRWNNKTYATSSSTVFELMDNVYKDTGVVFRSKSQVTVHPSYKSYTKQHVNFVHQNIEAWMIPKTFTDRPKLLPAKIKCKSDEERKDNIEVRISDQKWFIDKSKAFSHKIEVVLHSKNFVKLNKEASSEYLRIDIPKGFFVDSSSDDNNKQVANQFSDEKVFKIVEYETGSDLNKDRTIRNFNIGDHKQNNIKVTVSVKENKDCDSMVLETMIKRPPTNRDVVIQGSNVYIPKRCDVIGVGIITHRDLRDIQKPILKIQDDFSDEESEHIILRPNQKKCEFAQSYLQDYYRNWTPLGIDLYSWCVSDSHLRCCSENSKASFNNQGDVTKSCPNIFDDFQTSTIVSSCEASSCSHCHNYDDAEKPPKKCWFGKFKKTAKDPNDVHKRILPKDSIEVCKRRKIYAASMKSKWGTCPMACPSDYEPPCSMPSNESKGCMPDTMVECPKLMKSCCKPIEPRPRRRTCKKHVSLPDCDMMNELLAKQLAPGIPEGILAFKGTSGCDACKRKEACPKHAKVIPTPYCEIPRAPCRDSCEELLDPPCSDSKVACDNPPPCPPPPCQPCLRPPCQPCLPPPCPPIPPTCPPIPPTCPPNPPPCPPNPPPCPPNPPPCPPNPPTCPPNPPPCPPTPSTCPPNPPPCPPNPSTCPPIPPTCPPNPPPCPPNPPPCPPNPPPCPPNPSTCPPIPSTCPPIPPTCPPNPPPCKTPTCPPNPPPCKTPTCPPNPPPCKTPTCPPKPPPCKTPTCPPSPPPCEEPPSCPSTPPPCETPPSCSSCPSTPPPCKKPPSCPSCPPTPAPCRKPPSCAPTPPPCKKPPSCPPTPAPCKRPPSCPNTPPSCPPSPPPCKKPPSCATPPCKKKPCSPSPPCKTKPSPCPSSPPSCRRSPCPPSPPPCKKKPSPCPPSTPNYCRKPPPCPPSPPCKRPPPRCPYSSPPCSPSPPPCKKPTPCTPSPPPCKKPPPCYPSPPPCKKPRCPHSPPSCPHIPPCPPSPPRCPASPPRCPPSPPRCPPSPPRCPYSPPYPPSPPPPTRCPYSPPCPPSPPSPPRCPYSPPCPPSPPPPPRCPYSPPCPPSPPSPPRCPYSPPHPPSCPPSPPRCPYSPTCPSPPPSPPRCPYSPPPCYHPPPCQKPKPPSCPYSPPSTPPSAPCKPPPSPCYRSTQPCPPSPPSCPTTPPSFCSIEPDACPEERGPCKKTSSGFCKKLSPFFKKKLCPGSSPCKPPPCKVLDCQPLPCELPPPSNKPGKPSPCQNFSEIDVRVSYGSLTHRTPDAPYYYSPVHPCPPEPPEKPKKKDPPCELQPCNKHQLNYEPPELECKDPDLPTPFPEEQCDQCRTSNDEFPWPTKNQVSNQSSVTSLYAGAPEQQSQVYGKCKKSCPMMPKLSCETIPSPKKKKCKASCPNRQGSPRPQGMPEMVCPAPKPQPPPSPPPPPPSQCPVRSKSKPKISGLYLKMKPTPKKTTCSKDCLAWGNDQQEDGCISLNSEEKITIRLKKETPSTEEIREGLNIKVQDEDGMTLFERKDYRLQHAGCSMHGNSLLGDMYNASEVRRVTTNNSVQAIASDTESRKEIVEGRSDTSIANLIEIQFKLKVTQGEKTTEINIANDGDKENEVDEKTENEDQMNNNPQEVFIVKNDGEGPIDQSDDKNDINIRIVIKNFKPKSGKKKSINLKSDDYSTEFSKKISAKFHTVSTGYSDVLHEDNVFSVHRATVDLTSSVDKSKTHSNKSEEVISESLNEHARGILMGSEQSICRCITTDMSDCRIVEEDLKSIPSKKYSTSKETQEYPEDTDTEKLTEHKYDTEETDTDNKLAFRKYDTEETDTEKPPEPKYDTDGTDTDKLVEPKYDTFMSTDTDEQDAIPEHDTYVEKSKSIEVIVKPHTKDEKKEMLKHVFQKAHETKTKNKTRMKKLRDMLKVILTSDSSDHDETKLPKNDLAKDVTYASLKPNYFRDSDSMNNYYRTESNVVLSEGEINRQVVYPTGENNSEISNSNPSDVLSSENELPNRGCMCSTLAARLKLASRIGEGGGCCCGLKINTKKNEETTCDLKKDSDYFQYDYKTAECVDVETQNSRYLTSKINSTNLSLHKSMRSNIMESVNINQEESDSGIINVDDKTFNPLRKTFSPHMNHVRECEMRRLHRNTVLSISDEDKIVLLSGRSQRMSAESTKVRKKKYRDPVTVLHASDILQSYETKKAVLEIYTEKTISDEGERLVAKLPKFVYDRENEIQTNYEAMATNTYKAVCKKNIVMMAINR